LPQVLGAAPFARFMALSDWLYATTDATHRIALERLAALVAQWLQTQGVPAEEAAALVASDHAGKVNLPRAGATAAAAAVPPPPQPPRQSRHRERAAEPSLSRR
jgi:hypothetical protein